MSERPAASSIKRSRWAFFSSYAGSGLTIHCLARFQLTPRRAMASRMVGGESSQLLNPCSWQTSASNLRGPYAGVLAEVPWALVEDLPQSLPLLGGEHGLYADRHAGAPLQTGQATHFKVVDGIADGLAGAPQPVLAVSASADAQRKPCPGPSPRGRHRGQGFLAISDGVCPAALASKI